jgi:hypothetical protein
MCNFSGGNDAGIFLPLWLFQMAINMVKLQYFCIPSLHPRDSWAES